MKTISHTENTSPTCLTTNRKPLPFSICRLSLLLLLCGAALSAQSQVVINEVLASNSNVNADPDLDKSADWVELWNTGNEAVDLSGWSMTDNLKKPDKYVFPAGTRIEANDYLLVWCDDADFGLHAAFKLSADGEEIGLFDAQGTQIDGFAFPVQYPNVSYGRPAADASLLRYFTTPTPGAANTGAYYEGLSNQPVILTQGGFFSAPIEVTITNDLGGVVRYTLDGSEPTPESEVYTEPIALSETTIVRARIFEEGKMPGITVTASYFFGNEAEGHGLPVVSLASTPGNFWDPDSGIYVQDFKPDWEIPANIELFENNGSNRPAFNEPVGIKINALYAWQLPQKMLGVYFKKQYGESKLSYRLFKDHHRSTFDDFSLRASGSDWSYTLFRDGLLQQACRKTGTNLDLMAFRPSVVYLNGEFLGIHNIREKVNDDYVESNFGVPGGTFDMVEGGDYAECGDLDAWNDLTRLWNQDLSQQTNYDALADIFDIENFTDYMAAELFSHNTSLSHNTMAWKPKEGGKWRWILMDADRGFFKYGSDRTSYYEGKTCWPLAQLLKNEAYRSYFTRRVSDHLFVTFNPDEIDRQISAHQAAIQPLMEQQIARWKGTTSSYGNAIPSYNYWLNEVENVRDFCRGRVSVLLNDFDTNYGAHHYVQLMLAGSEADGGSYRFNGLPISRNSWDGLYPTQMPISLTVQPRDGMTFQGWRADSVHTFVSKKSEWRYLDDGSDQGTAWYDPAFDDSEWKQGAAPLGYSISSVATTVSYGSSSSKKHITTYFRRTFELERKPSTVLKLKLNLLREDGAAVYLNGHRIVRSNLPIDYDYKSLAPYACGSLAETSFLTFDVDPSLLVEGDNVLAVEVHQTKASSSDLIMDAELIGVTAGTDIVSTDTTYDFSLTHDLALTALYEPTGEHVLPDTIASDMVLYKAHSPYLAAADVVVKQGAHLTVEPGVEILFAPQANLVVHGWMTADGTPTDSIRMSLNPKYDDGTSSWGALCFIHADSLSSLSYATLTDASQGPAEYNCVAAISAFDARLALSHLRIDDVFSNPIAARHSDVSLTHSFIHSRVTGDLINLKYGTGRVEHCVFVGNDQVDTDAIDYDGITGGIIRDVVAHHFLGSNSDAVDIGEQAENVLIDSLLAYTITDKGISVGQRSSVTVLNSTFIQTNMGVAVKDSCHATVDRCTFFAVATPIASYEKVDGRGGGNVEVRRSILSNSYDASIECDERSQVFVFESLSDNDRLPNDCGNEFGDPGFELPALFNLKTEAFGHWGSSYLPEVPQPEPVIAEICYNPDSQRAGETEYLRLLNPSSQPLDLSGYYFDKGITYTLPEGTVIAPDSTLIITEDEWTEGHLSNEGETLRLCNPSGIVADQVTFGTEAPWPVCTDGLTVIQLISPIADNHLPESWRAALHVGIDGIAPSSASHGDWTSSPRPDHYYDFSGRAIQRPVRGYFIQNGKKYVIRKGSERN